MGVVRDSLWLAGWTIRALFLTARFTLNTAVFSLRWAVGELVSTASITHGSARWATLWEIIRGNAWGGRGIIIGKLWFRFLRFRQEGFVLLFAPTRTGKGYSVVIPNLLAYRGSMIVIDIKGENHAVTARSRAARGPVWTLNVLEPEQSSAFNPLDMVQVGTVHEADDAKQLADLMITPTADGEHWDEKARTLLGILILYVCHKHSNDRDLRTLAQVRALAAQDWAGLEATLNDAAALGPISLREDAMTILAMNQTDEMKSIKSTMDKATGLWSADKPAGMISCRSDFRFEDLNRRTGTIYLMVPEMKLNLYRGFLRVMVGCALIAMTRAKNAKPKCKTLLMLDEAAALGRLQPIEDGVGWLAAYMRMVMVFQDLDQLEKTYPKARSIIANAACKIAFGVSDVETARMLADSIGQTTILSRTAGESESSAETVRHQHSQGVSESGRYLIDPSEIMRLPSTRALILMPRQVRYPIRAKKVRYWTEPHWKGQWDIWRADNPAPHAHPSAHRQSAAGPVNAQVSRPHIRQPACPFTVDGAPHPDCPFNPAQQCPKAGPRQ